MTSINTNDFILHQHELGLSTEYNEPEVRAWSPYYDKTSNESQIRTNSSICFIDSNNFDAVLIQPFQDQENTENFRNGNIKIKIKDLKELQAPATTNPAEKERNIHDSLHQVSNSFNKTRDEFQPITDLNCMNKTYNSSNKNNNNHLLESSIKPTYLQLKELILKKRLAKIKTTSDILLDLKRKSKSVLPKKKTCSLSNLNRKTPEENNKGLIENCADTLVSVSQTKNRDLITTIKENDLNVNEDFLKNSFHDPTEESRKDFEFIALEESSLENLGTSLINESEEAPQDVLSLKVENCCSDYEVEQEKKNLIPKDTSPPKLPTYLADEVDSSVLRDGLIKASRTVISSQKELKLLLQVISRDKTLPSRQAINLIRRFQGVLKSFNTGFDQISQTIENEYNHISSESSYNTLVQKSSEECLMKNEKEAEMMTIEDKDCAKETVPDHQTSFSHKSESGAVRTEKIDTRGRKRRRRRIHLSDDEELDETFQPTNQSLIIATTSRRESSRRSAQKRKIYDEDKFYEYEIIHAH